MRRGLVPPSWFLDQPQLEYGDDFWLDAFYRLGTCRTVGMSMGAIPWVSVREYAEYYGLGPVVAEALFIIIRKLDSEYLSWYNKEAEKNK